MACSISGSSNPNNRISSTRGKISNTTASHSSIITEALPIDGNASDIASLEQKTLQNLYISKHHLNSKPLEGNFMNKLFLLHRSCAM